MTIYIAQELRAQRARLDLTIDQVAEKSGVPRTSVANALKPRGAISAETYAALCGALGIDPGRLMSEAVKSSA